MPISIRPPTPDLDEAEHRGFSLARFQMDGLVGGHPSVSQPLARKRIRGVRR